MPPLVERPGRDAAAEPLAQLVDVDNVERRQHAGVHPGTAVVVVVAVDGPQQVLDQPAQDPEVVATGRSERFLARLVEHDGRLVDGLASGVGQIISFDYR